VAQNNTQATVMTKSVSRSGMSCGANKAARRPDATPTSSTGWFSDMQRCSSAATLADGVMSRLFRISGTIRNET